MTLNECNPFIRSIKSHIVSESKSKTYALNHRLLYFTGGSGTMRIHRTSYPIYKDTAILYPAGVVYEVTVDTPLSFLTLNFDYTQNFSHITQTLKLQREGEGYATPLEEISFTDFPALNHEIYIPNAAYILSDIHSISCEMQEQKDDSQPYCSGLLKMIICKILRDSTVSSKATNSKVASILSFVHENYASNIDNKQIAAHLNYHPYYANKLFSSYSGMTIHQYVNHYRLLQASHYLSTSTMPIQQICYMVGFQSPAHFTENFKKKFGLSPKQYRNIHKHA